LNCRIQVFVYPSERMSMLAEPIHAVITLVFFPTIRSLAG
jgi:hypothetical protein